MKVLIIGKGRMATLIKTKAEEQGYEVLGLVDVFDQAQGKELAARADVILDFSHKDSLPMIADLMENTHAALVEGTTGYTDKEMHLLEKLAKEHPVMFSANYSLGIAVLKMLCKQAAGPLDGFDVEIVELHHRNKKDAPSGTALALAEAIDPDHARYVYGRTPESDARGSEIGFHSLRGGSAAGDHSVYFLGDQEQVILSHHADDRSIFVNGAFKAANWLKDQPNGLYGMDDLMSALQKEEH